MNQPATSPRRLHPLIATAAGTVIVASLAATAAITGLFPKASSTGAQTDQTQSAQVANQPVVDTAAPAASSYGQQQQAASGQTRLPQGRTAGTGRVGATAAVRHHRRGTCASACVRAAAVRSAAVRSAVIVICTVWPVLGSTAAATTIRGLRHLRNRGVHQRDQARGPRYGRRRGRRRRGRRPDRESVRGRHGAHSHDRPRRGGRRICGQCRRKTPAQRNGLPSPRPNG